MEPKTSQLVLHLAPELRREIKAIASVQGKTYKDLILESLLDHYPEQLREVIKATK